MHLPRTYIHIFIESNQVMSMLTDVFANLVLISAKLFNIPLNLLKTSLDVVQTGV